MFRKKQTDSEEKRNKVNAANMVVPHFTIPLFQHHVSETSIDY
jgi:hypothetical protein